MAVTNVTRCYECNSCYTINSVSNKYAPLYIVVFECAVSII